MNINIGKQDRQYIIHKLLISKKVPNKTKIKFMIHIIKKSCLILMQINPFSENMLQKRPSCLKKVVQTWDLHLLKDFKFVHMSLGLGLGYVSSISFSTFFPMFLQDEVKFDMWQTTTCMTALSATDIVGRMTISEIFRKMNLGNRSQFMLGAILLAIARSGE